MTVIWFKRLLMLSVLCCAMTGCLSIRLLDINEREVEVIEETPDKHQRTHPEIRQVSGDAFTAQELIMLKNSGVGADYIASLGRSGMTFTAQELILLKNSGVDPKTTKR